MPMMDCTAFKVLAGSGAILGMLLSLSCSAIVLTKSGMITPNEYSESVGKELMYADIDECDAQADAQRSRRSDHPPLQRAGRNLGAAAVLA